MVRWEINEETAYIQARSSMARALEINWKARQAQGESKSGLRKSSILKTHENCVAREMGSPRQAQNRRRRTPEGPKPACVLSPFRAGWQVQVEKDELTSCRGTV